MGDLRHLAAPQRQTPYSIEAEQSVIGGVLLDNRTWHEAAEILTAEDFFRADHQRLWRAIARMLDARTPVDGVTLIEHLRGDPEFVATDDVPYVMKLANDTPSAANVAAYATAVRERSVMRSLIAAGGDIAELGYRPDGRSSDELVADAQRRLMGVRASASTEGDPVLIGDDCGGWLDAYNARQQAKAAPGLQTGLAALDRLLIGLEPGDLVVAAGATGMGKTVLGLTIAEHVAQHAGAVLGFSLEMPRRQWLTRLVASRGRIPLQALRDPRQVDAFRDDEVVRALGAINSLPFYVSDQSGQTIQQIRSRTLRLAQRVPLKLVLVDYLQLVAGDRRNGDSRTNEVDSVSRGLKALAKEIGAPILALAQIANRVTERDNKRPRLSDLRESGGITQDADIVCLLYRDEYYHRNSPHAGVVEIEVAKQRNGKLDVAEVLWQGGYCAMTDYTGPSYRERMDAVEADKPAAGRRGMKSLLPKHLQP